MTHMTVAHPLSSCWRSLSSSWRRSCGSCSAAAAVSVERRSPRPDVELFLLTTKSPAASDCSWARAFSAISRRWRRISLCHSRENNIPSTRITHVAARQAGPTTCSGNLCAGVRSKFTKPITWRHTRSTVGLKTSRHIENACIKIKSLNSQKLINHTKTRLSTK